MSEAAATGQGQKKVRVKLNYALFLSQIFTAVILTSGILYGGYYYCHSIPVPKSNEFTDKLVYALRCCCYPGAVTIMLAVLGVGSKRGSTPALSPLSGNEQYVQLEKQFLANTVEQFLIFLLLSLTLITYLEPSEMRIVPLYAIVFVVGRIVFRIGYGFGAQYRSTGMWMAFSSAIFMIALNGYLMYSRGFLYGLDSTKFGPSVHQAAGKSEL